MLLLTPEGNQELHSSDKLITVIPRPSQKVNLTKTGVVVTCHNYGKFLGACIYSLLAQSKPFDKIIIVDDSSTDDTKNISQSYGNQVEYIYCQYRNPNDSRRLGVEKLGDGYKYLMFIDADNYISANYHQKLFNILESDNSLAVAYSKIKYFNNLNPSVFFKELSIEYNYNYLRHTNFADLMSLIRMEAYLQAGGIQNFYKSDWNMWLRITQLGWGMKLCKEATEFYRVHGSNGHLSRSKKKDDEDTFRVQNDALKVCIITLFSGRDWNLDRYINSLKSLDCNKDNIFIIAIDNSCDKTFNYYLNESLNILGINYTIIKEKVKVNNDIPSDEVTDKREHRVKLGRSINTHLANLYAKAKTFIPKGTDLVWSIEDDVVVPPHSLKEFILAFNDDKSLSTLSGCIRSRFESNLIGCTGTWGPNKAENVEFFKDVPKERLTYILGTGMFCSIFRVEHFDKLVFQEKPNDANAYWWYDWAIHKNVYLKGGKLALLNTVQCIHWTSAGYGLLPNGSTITKDQYETRGTNKRPIIQNQFDMHSSDTRSDVGGVFSIEDNPLALSNGSIPPCCGG